MRKFLFSNFIVITNIIIITLIITLYNITLSNLLDYIYTMLIPTIIFIYIARSDKGFISKILILIN